MKQELQNEILQRVDALAERLGTTAEYLWPAAVWHTQVISGAKVFGGVLAFFLILITMKRLSKWAKKEEYTLGEPEYGMPMMILGIGLVVAFIFPLTGIADMLAPEGATLKALLGN